MLYGILDTGPNSLHMPMQQATKSSARPTSPVRRRRALGLRGTEHSRGRNRGSAVQLRVETTWPK